jgi:hypothetical protein
MLFAPAIDIIADELTRLHHRVLSVAIARDANLPQYLHLISLCIGESPLGGSMFRGDLADEQWIRAWVDANWGRVCCHS